MRLALAALALTCCISAHAQQLAPYGDASPPVPTGRLAADSTQNASIRSTPLPESQQRAIPDAQARMERADAGEHEKRLLDWWTTGATVVLALVTLGLAIFTYRLWKATRTLVVGAKDASGRQLRAYVNVRGASVQMIVPNSEPIFTVSVRNYGQTPAHRIVSWMRMNFGADPEAIEFNDSNYDDSSGRSILAPGEGIEMVIGRTTLWTSQEVGDLARCASTASVYGEVKYLDVFGNERYTRFNLLTGGHYGLKDQVLRHAKRGNCTDEVPDD